MDGDSSGGEVLLILLGGWVGDSEVGGGFVLPTRDMGLPISPSHNRQTILPHLFFLLLATLTPRYFLPERYPTRPLPT